jgi:hypothetical protein
MKKSAYPKISDKIFSAIREGLYRYSNLEEAENALNSLKERYIISTKKSDLDSTSSVVFWIHDYELTDDEVEKGHKGNFAKVSIKMLQNNFYTLLMEKIPEEELRLHPQRRRPKAPHPNKGHPVIRSALKNKRFQKEKDALYELEKLHIEYPNSTIPAENKLYLMIYSKEFRPPVKKHVLEVKEDDSGEFFLDLRENKDHKLPKHKFDEVFDTISSYLVKIED